MDAPSSAAPSTPPTVATPAAGTGTPPAPPTPPSSGVEPPSLFTFLGEDLRTNPALKRYEKADIETFVKSHLELEKTLGQRPGVKPLGENPTADEIAAYHKALGVPEAPDGYQLDASAYPEAVALPPEDLAWWQQTAHKYHLTPAQVQGILNDHAAFIGQRWTDAEADSKAEIAGTEDAMRQKWGGLWRQQIEIARETLRRTYGDEAVGELENVFIRRPDGRYSMLANEPLFLDILIENAQLKGHDKFVLGDGRGGVLSQDSARQRYDELWAARAKATNDLERRTIDQQLEALAPVAFMPRAQPQR